MFLGLLTQGLKHGDWEEIYLLMHDFPRYTPPCLKAQECTRESAFVLHRCLISFKLSLDELC